MESSATKGLTLRSHTGVAYRFDPGALCLELLTTGGPGPYRRYEVLREPADLAAWAERSRLTPTPVLEISAAEVAGVRELRDALFRAVLAHLEGRISRPATSRSSTPPRPFRLWRPPSPRPARSVGPETRAARTSRPPSPGTRWRC